MQDYSTSSMITLSQLPLPKLHTKDGRKVLDQFLSALGPDSEGRQSPTTTPVFAAPLLLNPRKNRAIMSLVQRMRLSMLPARPTVLLANMSRLQSNCHTPSLPRLYTCHQRRAKACQH